MAFAILLAALAGAAAVQAAAPAPAPPSTDPNEPLFLKHFTWGNLPFQADTGNGDRGTQTGYNVCNSTTEGPNSLCQTATINSLADFCLWGPPKPNSAVGDTEGESVAWCTQPGRGTRVIPQGAITGVTFVKTPDYVQVTGHINQQLINLAADDGGGELDPHGADQRGNPLGALVFSNNLPTNTKPGGNNFQQANEWHNFMGSNVFCFKACDPKGPRAADLCQHVFDRIGCDYNAPAGYVDGVFETCEGESQDPPGVYTGVDGAVSTYKQPAESLGPIMSFPYVARVPKSSNCVPAQSSALYASAPAPSVTAAPSSSVPASSSAAITSAASGVTPKPSAASSASSSAKPTSSSNASFHAGSVDGLAMFSAAAMGIVAMIAGVAVL